MVEPSQEAKYGGDEEGGGLIVKPLEESALEKDEFVDEKEGEKGSENQPEDDENDVDDEDEGLFSKEIQKVLGQLLKVSFIVLIVVYLLAAFIIDFQRATALFVITILFLAWGAFSYYSKHNEDAVYGVEGQILDFFEKSDSDWKYGGGLVTVLLVIMMIIMVVTVNNGRNLVSLFGLIVFFILTWLFSWKPKRVKLRPVIGGIFIQFIFGYAVIRTSWGLTAMEFAADTFTTLLSYTAKGSGFVFAWLIDGSLFGRPFQLLDGDAYFLGPPLFFNVLPTVVFFSALMSVGYYVRILPWMVKTIGRFLGVILGTSASESLSAAGNIFVGQTEAPMLVRPFMAEMTESELHAIMTGGFATIAGSVFGLYVSFGVDPKAILAASIMSAPAALSISKVAFPETKESKTASGKKGAYHIPPSGDANIVHAATNGAVVGTQLMMNIAGNLIAFLAIIEMLDQLLMYLGDRVDIELSFNRLCEIFFWPVAWLMGVDVDDCDEVAVLLGLKIFANEFVAYQKLAFEFKGQISDRSYFIASYALCGFANMGSVGIQLGGLTPMAPNQGEKLAKLAMSAMIAGNTACLITACIAGIFYDGSGDK